MSGSVACSQPARKGYDIILMAGQSNCMGAGTPISFPTDDGNSRTLQYAQAGASINTIIQADEPLRHPDTFSYDNSLIGFGVAFAKLYAAAIPIRRSVLLVPSATSGTGFSDSRWNPGDDLYTGAVSAANGAISASPAGSKFVGVLWHQGENDAVAGWTQSQYATAVDALIAGFRSDITGAAHSWFVLGQMVPEYISNQGAGYTTVDAAHQATPSRNSRCAFWAGNTGTGVNIHYDAARQRFNGASAFAALSSLSA